MQSKILSKMAALIGVDRDIQYALASRFISAGGQLITLGLVSFLMPPVIQGYHFTFLSFAAAQTVFELGFYLVIVNTAAHEWAHLHLTSDGAVTGREEARQRLSGLMLFSARWYAFVSIAFIAAAITAGWAFFSAQQDIGLPWQAPWTALVLAAALQIWSNAALAFVEGCGQVAEAYRIRVIASIVSQVAGWLILFVGHGLWVSAITIGGVSITQLFLIWHRYAPLFQSLLRLGSAHTISWRAEIWPLQWRLGLQGLSSFFFFSIITPVAFHYHGAAAAGRVGLSWTIANGLYSMMSAWPQARAARLAILVAQAKHKELNKLFWNTLLFSTAGLVAILVLVWSVLTWLHMAGAPIAERFLPPIPLACFFVAALLLQISASFSTYFRAHKQDPSTAIVLVTGVAIGLVTWVGGSLSGPAAMASGFLFVLAVLLLPGQLVLFVICRRKWHSLPLSST